MLIGLYKYIFFKNIMLMLLSRVRLVYMYREFLILLFYHEPQGREIAKPLPTSIRSVFFTNICGLLWPIMQQNPCDTDFAAMDQHATQGEYKHS